MGRIVLVLLLSMMREWTPEHDLDGLMDDKVEDDDEEMTLTGRGVNFYDAISPRSGNLSSDRSDSEKHYKKKRASKKSQKKGGSIHRIKKSLQEAIGSIGRSFSKGKKKFQELAKGEEGWEIFRTEKYDTPPDGPITIKAIEMHPVYAYNSDKDQLMLLPDYDRVIVTDDGRKILEADLLKIEKFKKTVSEIGSTKQRARLSNVFTMDDNHMTPREREVQEERQLQDLMEVQFAHIRKLSKKLSAEDQGHSSVRSLRGLLGYSDVEPHESSASGGQDYDAYSLDRALNSQKKRGNRYRKSNVPGNKPRHKVLIKGMDAYTQNLQPPSHVSSRAETLPVQVVMENSQRATVENSRTATMENPNSAMESSNIENISGSKIAEDNNGARVSVVKVGETEDNMSAHQSPQIPLQAETTGVTSTETLTNTTASSNIVNGQPLVGFPHEYCNRINFNNGFNYNI